MSHLVADRIPCCNLCTCSACCRPWPGSWPENLCSTTHQHTTTHNTENKQTYRPCWLRCKTTDRHTQMNNKPPTHNKTKQTVHPLMPLLYSFVHALS